MNPIPRSSHANGILPFTITNFGYVDYVKNFCARLKTLKMFPKFVVVCTDAKAYKALENDPYIHCVYSPEEVSNELVEWKTREYKQVVFNKLDITRQILITAAEKKISRVLYIDTDIWIYKNFLKELKQIIKDTDNNTDILMQDGENYTEFPRASKSRKCTRFCTGFMVLKPTKEVINLFDYRKNKLTNWNKFVGNQPYINEVIKQRKIKTRALDRELLPNGSIFLAPLKGTSQLKNPWLLHYTYLLGKQKQEKMTEEGHWTVINSSNHNQTPYIITNDKPDVFVKCTDGLTNQMRLALAGSFLVQSNFIRSYTQEWTVNNHNNVNFTDYFQPLPKVNFKTVDVDPQRIIETVSFQTMIERFAKSQYHWSQAFQIASRYLIPKPEVIRMVDTFAQVNNLQNAIGLHVRRTCKDALLKEQGHRSTPLTNEELLPLCDNYPKVFLATDNAETQKWFSDRLGEKLCFVGKIKSGKEKFKSAYDPKKVIRHTDGLHTVLDLLSLKCCRTFQGSNESSFSLLLYHWRNNPYDFHVFGKF